MFNNIIYYNLTIKFILKLLNLYYTSTTESHGIDLVISCDYPYAFSCSHGK